MRFDFIYIVSHNSLWVVCYFMMYQDVIYSFKQGETLINNYIIIIVNMITYMIKAQLPYNMIWMN